MFPPYSVLHKSFIKFRRAIASASLAVALAPSLAFGQQDGWESPITTYGSNLLSGFVNVVTTVLILAFLGLMFWGFFSQDNRKFWWAAGCIIGAVLAQLTDTLFSALTTIGA